MVSAVFWRLAGEASIHLPASSMAAVTARAVFGWRATKSALAPSTFSGCSGQMACEVTAVKPMRSWMARAPQGSPTQ